jgi:hypothetical protein
MLLPEVKQYCSCYSERDIIEEMHLRRQELLAAEAKLLQAMKLIEEATAQGDAAVRGVGEIEVLLDTVSPSGLAGNSSAQLSGRLWTLPAKTLDGFLQVLTEAQRKTEELAAVLDEFMSNDYAVLGVGVKQLDQDSQSTVWTFHVAGQTFAKSDLDVIILSDISAPDSFGLEGPGTAP